jgi:hypothetical protein
MEDPLTTVFTGLTVNTCISVTILIAKIIIADFVQNVLPYARISRKRNVPGLQSLLTFATGAKS